MQFVELEAAKTRPGMRLVSVGGVPSPWSEAAKGILHVKRIPHVGVRLTSGDAAIAEWTGCDNAPVALFEDEAPRSGWAEILLLAERLAPTPRLIPEDPDERALLFGLAFEICGEDGFGWCRRLQGIVSTLEGEATGFPPPGVIRSPSRNSIPPSATRPTAGPPFCPTAATFCSSPEAGRTITETKTPYV